MITTTTELNDSIIEYLNGLGILCDILKMSSCGGIESGVVTINRTSMCGYDLCHGLDEEDCYKMVLELIREHFSDPIYWIVYSGKTDDDYYLEVYIR